MSESNISMSLTPPGELGLIEKIGLGILGAGLLSLLVAFVGTGAPAHIPFLFCMTSLVFAFVLLSKDRSRFQNISLGLIAVGLISMVFVFTKLKLSQEILAITSIGFTVVGGLIYVISHFSKGPAGIRNNGITFSQWTKKNGVIAWILGIMMTGFYVLLYWYPHNLHGLIVATNPIATFISDQESFGQNADGSYWYNQWFMYSFFYTAAIIVMGTRFAIKYRHNRYQLLRTVSVSFCQLVIAFLLPQFLGRMNYHQQNDYNQSIEQTRLEYEPKYYAWSGMNQEIETLKNSGDQSAENISAIGFKETKRDSLQQLLVTYYPKFQENLPTVSSHYFSYFWPLGYDSFFPSTIEKNLGKEEPDQVYKPWQTKFGFGKYGLAIVIWTLIISTIGVVVLTYFFGKRWYCSFVCGCGGLAETAGDPFRHLSDKSLKAWRVERILVHSVLAFITLVTVGLLVDWKVANIFSSNTGDKIQKIYGFFIGSIFAGVIGTGFYPILGSRVWCRFGCPQAAILGILQKYFSRFRITTNGSQCISCGNCSTYCEMGIDVRWYAQRGQNIVRASCVGCGICSAVCPRGVLKLENGPNENRTAIHISREAVGVIM